MIVSLIVAYSRNRAIVKDNKLLWNLKGDMKNFVKLTKGKHYLMGRKTFESIGKPLPNRVNIILSRSENDIDGVVVKEDLMDAINYAKKQGADELVIGGGADVYKQAMDKVTRMYITEVDCNIAGDTFFPEFDEGEWECVTTFSHEKDSENDYNFEYLEYIKKENLPVF